MQRIISLVPSKTELLHYLGAGDQVVGITKFCIHPDEWFRSKTRIGGTKKLHLDKIRALAPDLIIANKEENNRADIELLMQEYPVYLSDILSWQDALNMIAELGELLQCQPKAQELIRQLTQKNKHYQAQIAALPRPRVAYLIWREPYMAAAKNTFIDAMLELAGFRNAFADLTRYPMLDEAALQAANPDVILLSSEPYPFAASHIAELQRCCPHALVQLADGELFSWYGNRLLHSFDYFYRLRVPMG